ncbi:hypothetical protein AGDE_03993 [Angomonas deanei]|nr:hypothetical protein AGDE_05475 [Angomonas deanei]EPY39935.1 hypothetical protein AGDE_03993 [Angomonas deanei]|eukprot:EPY38454.1 hypothetical protein AGDE_05475 [Angomonas deanei]
MLRQDVHKYLRVGALFLIRLIGNPAMQREAMKIGFDDYRKIRVYGNEEERETSSTKRPREEEEKDAKEWDSTYAPIIHPHYFIMRLDEITERLFLPEKKGGEGPKMFLGIHLPPLIL